MRLISFYLSYDLINNRIIKYQSNIIPTCIFIINKVSIFRIDCANTYRFIYNIMLTTLNFV